MHPPPPFGSRAGKPSALRPRFLPGSCRASIAYAARMLSPPRRMAVRIYIVFISGKVCSKQSVRLTRCRSRKSIRPWSEASRPGLEGKAATQGRSFGLRPFLRGGCALAQPDAGCAASIEHSAYALPASLIARREACMENPRRRSLLGGELERRSFIVSSHQKPLKSAHAGSRPFFKQKKKRRGVKPHRFLRGSSQGSGKTNRAGVTF